MDKRKNYYLIVDTETANGLDQPLIYDFGYVVCDKKGNVYEKGNSLIYEVFCQERELMKTAYYAEKIPRYQEKIKRGEIKIENLLTAYYRIKKLVKEYRIKTILAYNARFDLNSLNTTLRYITKSQYRYFFPYGTEVNCIMAMACTTIYKQKTFLRQAIREEKFTPKGFIKTNAEVGYRYITNNKEFIEEHTALADALIEMEIFAKCNQQHKKMTKKITNCFRIPTQEAKKLGLL